MNRIRSVEESGGSQMGLFTNWWKELPADPVIYNRIIELITDDEVIREGMRRIVQDPMGYYQGREKELKEKKISPKDTNEMCWRALMEYMLEKGIAMELGASDDIDAYREDMGALAAGMNLPFDPAWFNDDLRDPIRGGRGFQEPDLFYDYFPDDERDNEVDWNERLDEEWMDDGYCVGAMCFRPRVFGEIDGRIHFILKRENVEELKKLAKQTKHTAGKANESII